MAKDSTILETSEDPKQIISTAVEFAGSDQADDQAVVYRFLNSRNALLRVNTEQEYVASRAKLLKVARVLRTLMDSRHAASKSTLVALTRAKDFRSFELLEELLVRALAAVRPSPAEAIEYWDQHSQPESDNLHLVIEAIFANGSDPALALFERKIADERQDVEARTIWLRDPMLRHRNDTPVLQCCYRMVVGGTGPEPMRELTVEALCDYKREWYLACQKPRPPLRLLAPEESKDVLHSICVFARSKMKLSPQIEAAVERTLVELDGKKSDS